MSDILERLKTEVLIGPGDLPTYAAKVGFDMTENVQLWAVNHPDEYKEQTKAWIDVGCDFVLSNHGGCSRIRLKRFGLQDKTHEINHRLLELTKEAASGKCYVSFSVSNTGAFLPPLGNASADEIYESYAEQIAIAEELGVDLIRLNVKSIDEEMELNLKAVKDHSKAPVAVILSFHPTPKGPRTLTGLDPITAVKRSEELGAELMGQTCGGLKYEEVTTTLMEMRAVCNKPFYTRPNAGFPELINDKPVHPQAPEQYAKEAPNWIETGAKIIAGCCGTTPEHTAKIIATLK